MTNRSAGGRSAAGRPGIPQSNEPCKAGSGPWAEDRSVGGRDSYYQAAFEEQARDAELEELIVAKDAFIRPEFQAAWRQRARIIRQHMAVAAGTESPYEEAVEQCRRAAHKGAGRMSERDATVAYLQKVAKKEGSELLARIANDVANGRHTATTRCPSCESKLAVVGSGCSSGPGRNTEWSHDVTCSSRCGFKERRPWKGPDSLGVMGA